MYSFANGFDAADDLLTDVPRASVSYMTGFSVVGDYVSWFPDSTYDPEYTGTGYVSGLRFSKGVGDLDTKALYISRPLIEDTFVTDVNLILEKEMGEYKDFSISCYAELSKPSRSIPFFSFLATDGEDPFTFATVWLTEEGKIVVDATTTVDTDGSTAASPTAVASTDKEAINFSNGFYFGVEFNRIGDGFFRVYIDGNLVLEYESDFGLSATDTIYSTRLYNVSSAYYASSTDATVIIDDFVLQASDNYTDLYVLNNYSVQRLSPTSTLSPTDIVGNFSVSGSGLGAAVSSSMTGKVSVTGGQNVNRYMLSSLGSEYTDIHSVYISYNALMDDADQASLVFVQLSTELPVAIPVTSSLTFTATQIGNSVYEIFADWKDLSGAFLLITES